MARIFTDCFFLLPFLFPTFFIIHHSSFYLSIVLVICFFGHLDLFWISIFGFRIYYLYPKAVGFIYSRCGFTAEAETYCREKGIACSEDERWLGG
jgi:hypothetical protein